MSARVKRPSCYYSILICKNKMSMNTTALHNEFPLWRPLVAVKLSLFWGILLPTTLFFNISLFVALVRSTLKHKPLLVLYGSLLLGLCVDKLLICVEESVNSPSTIGYCVCIKLTLVLLSMPRAFFVVYSVVVVTCQSVLQLLIMKGRQEWQNSYKRSIGCLIVSAAVATVWTVAFFVSSIFSEFPHHCHSFCSPVNSTDVGMDYSLYIVIGYVILTLAPAFLVTLTASIWAYLVFKKKFMATSKKDAAFSRRLFLLPVLMVILLFCNSLLSYVITVVTDEALDKASLGLYFGHWANLLSTMLYFVLDMFHALSYPLILLFLYARLRKTWKSLLSCKKQSLKIDSSHSQKNYSMSSESSPQSTSA